MLLLVRQLLHDQLHLYQRLQYHDQLVQVLLCLLELEHLLLLCLEVLELLGRLYPVEQEQPFLFLEQRQAVHLVVP